MKNLFIILTIFFFYSCGQEKFDDVHKVSMIEYNDVGIAKQVLSVSSEVATKRCLTQIEQLTNDDVKVFRCTDSSHIEIEYPDDTNISFHLKALARAEEIIVIDEDNQILAMGDFSFFTSEVFSDEGKKIIKTYLNNERATLVITYKESKFNAIEL